MHLQTHIPRIACLLLTLSGCERIGIDPDPDTEQPDLAWERPDNDWAISHPPAGLIGEGFEVGQTVPDLRLVDQNGDIVSLWQFWGDVVLVTVSAVWCGPCHDLAVTAEEVLEDLAPRGVTLLTILEEDGGGLSPELEDAVAWSDSFGAASPVMVDPEHELSSALQGSYPAVLLLDRELVVVEHARDLSSENLHDLIESEL